MPDVGDGGDVGPLKSETKGGGSWWTGMWIVLVRWP
jgi:hypothetical protein